MLVDLPQFASSVRTAGQFGDLRLMHLLNLRQFPMHKLPLTALASRPPRPLHPLPPCERRCLPFSGTLQFFHALAQLIVHLLQPFDLLLLFLNNQQRLGQLLFQLGNPWVLRIRLRVLPSFSHHRHLTFFNPFQTRAFPPVFFKMFDPFLFSTFER